MQINLEKLETRKFRENGLSIKIVSTDMNKLITIFVLTAFIPVGKPMLNFSRRIKLIVQNSIATV